MVDLKELEKLLEEEESKQEVENLPPKERVNKDVLRFIRNTGVAPGDNKVPTYVIYYHFIKWCKPKWVRLWGKEEFFRTFKKHFEAKRHGNQRFYMINDALDLSSEFYEKAKKYDYKWQKRKQTRKK